MCTEYEMCTNLRNTYEIKTKTKRSHAREHLDANEEVSGVLLSCFKCLLKLHYFRVSEKTSVASCLLTASPWPEPRAATSPAGPASTFQVARWCSLWRDL